ncbi:tetratricopeptide repeat-containing protein, partial [Gammaproteobacteria bacterium AB-CW1]|nr:tetratricopeptide repeat-containing protein [Gammaproteobacteria bacterium AB-CW1]
GQHLLAIAASIEEVLDQAPILSTTLIERAIDLGAWRMAEELLRRARARSFYNQRIIEMEALLHSRQGNPEKAIQLLRPKKYSGRSHQHEAKGILAGAYKRVWQQSGDAGQLKKAAELYAEAWKRSEQTDTYCGINSAACSLWMGDADNATRIAAQVEKTLARQSSHWQKSNGDVGTWHFYDLATMAEALLIQQKPEHADWERDTLLAAKTQGAPLAVFQGQMQRHRETLGMD